MARKETVVRYGKISCGILVMAVLTYMMTILWRVSSAEHANFGRSELLPITQPPPKFNRLSVPESFGSRTFLFYRNQRPITVWKQKINAFQHVYGSALMAYELGDGVADVAFCGNEWVEALFDHDGVTERDFQDRRKDLFHNKLGRQIGMEARTGVKQGGDADQWMQQRIADKMESGSEIILHHKDPRVERLETEEQLHCPGLPRESLLQMLKIQTVPESASESDAE